MATVGVESGATTSPTTPSRGTYAEVGEKLPMAIKLAYAMPGFAGMAISIPLGIHMNVFYADTVLVPLGYIGFAIALARGLDALTDPLMGWITDRTNTRWGRRRPWILLGAPLSAICLIMLFSPPESLKGVSGAVWFTVFYLSYFVFHTMYSIPYAALGPELTQDYKERSSVFAWVEAFQVVGALVAGVLPTAVLIPLMAGDEYAAYMLFASIFGGLLTGLYFFQVYRIRERADFYQRKTNPIAPGLRRVVRNRPARILLLSHLAGHIIPTSWMLLVPFFIRYVLQPENPGYVLAAFLALAAIVNLAVMPVWVWAARKWGKRPVYIGSRLLMIVVGLGWFMMGEGDLAPAFLFMLLHGFTFASSFLSNSIKADVIDYDELHTGRRREAQYFSVMAFINKFATIPGAAVPLAIMGSLGYEPNVEQTDTVKFGIRALIGLAPAISGLLSLAVFTLFPINEKNHAAVLEGIERHKRGEDAVDPLTGKVISPPTKRGVEEETGWFLDHFSVRELRRSLERGAGVVVWSTGAMGGLCLVFVGWMAWLITPVFSDLSVEPTWTTSIYVTVAGFAVAAFVYHVARLRAARRLVAQRIPRATIETHLENTQAARR